MKLNDWPIKERPRERLLNQGASALSDAELLATLLGRGLPGTNAVELSREWLNQTGGLAALVDLERKEFLKLRGAGEARYVLLQALGELGQRRLREQLSERPVLSDPDAVEAFLMAEYAGEVREHFGCLLLDTQHRVIAWQVLFSGTLNAAAVYPREVVSLALSKGAAAVILAHNHPSGVAEPSQADRQITERLCAALALIDVPVLDHLVIGRGEAVSFARRGWI